MSLHSLTAFFILALLADSIQINKPELFLPVKLPLSSPLIIASSPCVTLLLLIGVVGVAISRYVDVMLSRLFLADDLILVARYC